MDKTKKEIRYWVASNRSFPGRDIETPEELIEKLVEKKGELIFFPFWSWKIPDEILDNHTCVGFHSAPLPQGRGGTPIQNMIRLGKKHTELCMFRVTGKLDGGDVLMRQKVDLSGKLNDILERLRTYIFAMINTYNAGPLPGGLDVPTGVNNVPDKFKRIISNVIPEHDSLKKIYDDIRMRDANDHPKACRFHGKYVIEFTDATLEKGCVSGRFKFVQR